MDSESVLLLIAFTVNLFLTLFLFFRAKKTPANVSLILLAAVVTIWCISKYFFRIAPPETSLIWAKLQAFFPLFTPPTFLLFGLYFPKNTVSPRILNAIILVTFIVTSLTLLPDAVIRDVTVIPGEEKEVVFGWAYYAVYIWFLPIMFLCAYYILIKKYFGLTRYLKMQILYIFLGSLITSLGAMTTNLLLPTLGIFEYNWVGQLFTVAWIICISYAIMKHRLLDVRFIVARAITNGLFLVLLGFVYTLGIFIFVSFVIGEPLRPAYIIPSTIFALFIALSFQPLRKIWAEKTDKIFFAHKYHTNELVLELTKIMASTLHVTELAQKTLHELVTTMRIDQGAFILFDKPDAYHMITEGATIKEAFSLDRTKHLVSQKKLYFLMKRKMSK